MFIGELRLRKKTNEYLVGVGAHDDPQRTNLRLQNW